MTIGNHIYTTGFYWGIGGMVVLLLFGLSLIACGVYVRIFKPGHGHYSLPNLPVSLTWIGGGLLIVAMVAGFSFPYDMDYHARVPISGEVAQVDSRLIADGKAMSEKFVITYAGSSQEFGCLDTRCATVREGDNLSLLCTKRYDWNSADGWDCGWGNNQKAP